MRKDIAETGWKFTRLNDIRGAYAEHEEWPRDARDHDEGLEHPVRNDVAGTLGRMQPRCQQYRGDLHDEHPDHALKRPVDPIIHSADIASEPRDNAAHRRRVVKALAPCQDGMQEVNVQVLRAEQPDLQ